ncbi:MAG: hypothetical protein MZW92_25465 [Comamonadaceae bacterium]|nr:hypothetical protein [Comamonadaceae bacterium]
MPCGHARGGVAGAFYHRLPVRNRSPERCPPTALLAAGRAARRRLRAASACGARA